MKLRVGIIGLGNVGRVHLEAYQSARLVEVVAVADIDDVRLHALESEAGVTGYTDYGRMIASERLDIACVLTPAVSHMPIALECCRAGIPTLCEKPLGTSIEDGSAMVHAFAEADVPLFYGSCYRYLPAITAARDLIQSGAIGKVRLVREDYVGGSGPGSQRPFSADHYPPGLPGGTGMGLVDHGVHLIDVVPWLVGSKVVAAIGAGNRSGHPLDVEYAILHLENGAVAALTYDDGTWPGNLPHEGIFSWGSGWDSEGYRPAGQWVDNPGCIEIYGTTGSLRIFHYANALFCSNAEGIRQIAVGSQAAPGHFAAQIDTFAGDLLNKTAPSVSGIVGLEALSILDAIYRSAETGRMEQPRSVTSSGRSMANMDAGISMA